MDISGTTCGKEQTENCIT